MRLLSAVEINTDCHQMRRLARYLPENRLVFPNPKHKLSPDKKECARGNVTPGFSCIKRECNDKSPTVRDEEAHKEKKRTWVKGPPGCLSLRGRNLLDRPHPLLLCLILGQVSVVLVEV